MGAYADHQHLRTHSFTASTALKLSSTRSQAATGAWEQTQPNSSCSDSSQPGSSCGWSAHPTRAMQFFSGNNLHSVLAEERTPGERTSRTHYAGASGKLHCTHNPGSD